MKISEIYEFESNRQFPSDKYKIRLFREGNWWRAYEWSAYLAHNFPNGLEDKERLNVSKKHYVELNKDLVVVGLQLRSFEKYLPNVKDKEEIFSINDNYIDIDTTDFFDEKDLEYEDFASFLNSWKEKFILLEKKKKKDVENNGHKNESFGNSNKITCIIREIADYQISDKTLVENTVFLNDIQSKLKRILS